MGKIVSGNSNEKERREREMRDSDKYRKRV
jgi:hypothetical protein